MSYLDEIVRDILPADLGAYLLARGWKENTHAHPKASLWTLNDGWRPETAEDEDEHDYAEGYGDLLNILVPRATEFSDYFIRVAQGLALLERIERRPWTTIARDVLLVGADVVRMQCEVGSEQYIPLDDGRLWVDGLFDLLTAAACSAVVPRPVLPNRRPLQALDYMRRVQLGHTERGSFVFTAVSRVDPLNTPGSAGLEELWSSPFPRQVTSKLTDALAAVTEATKYVRETDSFDAFVDLVGRGVSANLCDSIAGMVSHADTERPVDISVSWASTLPNVVGPQQPRYHFAPDHAPILRQAAAKLRSIAPIEDELITGVVTRLSRGEAADSGIVTVTTVVQGATRSLQVPLNPADYRRAVEAHRDRLQVFFKATLVRRGRGWGAQNVGEFRVMG